MKKIKISALLLLSCTIAWGHQISEQETTLLELGKPQVTEIKSLGENINTASSELLPVLSPDGNNLYFSRESKEKGATMENIWVSEKDGESWDEPTRLIAPFGTKGSHYVLQYLPAEGKKLPMLILGNNYGKGTEETPLMYSYSKDNGRTWGKPKEIKIKNVEGFKQRTVCYLTLDRQHLLLAMTHKNGFGGDDIFMCTATGEAKFGPPVNMGNDINSEADETAPFLSPAGDMLYFSSNNPGSSHGELDLYVSARLSDSSWNDWSAPINLGDQINTPYDDTDFFIMTDGTAYFSRGVDAENEDLYQAKVGYLSPYLMMTVKGKMLNKKKQPVAGRIAVERSSNGQPVNMVDNDPATGEYTMQVEGADRYEMYGIVDDKHSEKVNLDLYTATGEKEAPVIYISKEQALANSGGATTTPTPGENSKTPIADKSASVAVVDKSEAADKKEKIQSAEKVASLRTPTPTSSPAISSVAKVSKPVSETPAPAGSGIAAKKTAENPAPVVSKNVASFATSSSSLSGSSNKVLFEINQAVVAPEYLEALDRVASELASQPARTVRLAGYADPTGPSEWNLNLSKLRAKAVAKYLKKKGVSSSQIDVQYYGEENSQDLSPSAGRRVEISFEEGIANEQIINFEFNRDIVVESYQGMLDKLAVQVKNGGVVQLSGYTDSSGPSYYNMSLSKRRAQAVANALESRGVPAEKIITHYYGSENPIDPTRKSRNRRVEIRIN